MQVFSSTANRIKLIQPELFDTPNELALTKIDISIEETKTSIRNLISENSSTERTRSRYDIEKGIVDAYKALSDAYKARYKITKDTPDEQKGFHYKEIYIVLNKILFSSRRKELRKAAEIRDKIFEVTKGTNNDSTTVARSMAQGWKNLLVASILAARGIAEKEFPIPAELPL